MHEVRIGRSATKELESLPGTIIERVATKIDSLADQPRPAGCKKLRGADDLWRIRVGDYRIIYAVDDTREPREATGCLGTIRQVSIFYPQART